MLEAADTPALRFLLDHGSYRRAVSTFPSLTPVCLASIATGGGPDVHGIPHLVWWNRTEERLVEYGSSFGALLASGLKRGAARQRREPERAAPAPQRRDRLRGARGRGPDDGRDQHHDLPRPAPAPLAAAGLPAGVRAEAVLLLQPLRVRQDGREDRLARQPLGRDDGCVRGDDRALARHARRLRAARLLPSRLRLRLARGRARCRARGARPCRRRDHGAVRGGRRPGRVPRSVRGRALLRPRPDARSSASRTLAADGALVTASNRAAQVYGDDPRALAASFDDEPSVDLALFLDDGEVVARRAGEEDVALLDDYPDGRARAEAALRNPNAGEVLLSAAPGWEFADLGGRHHAGGGSHGSLAASDSLVPMLTVGLGRAAGLDHRDQGARARALRRRRARAS